MKKLITFAFMLSLMLAQAQEKEPTYEAVGDLVKATYYYADGSIHRQGFFKDMKLTGKWTQFDQEGNKVAVAFYKKGQKVGTWFQWKGNVLRQINYENNTIASVNVWRQDTGIAVSNK